jgi:D-beta-D-heptose 7-phosphate kinase/D-beta-D-heptose 1-phosphate adenosyltransferase
MSPREAPVVQFYLPSFERGRILVVGDLMLDRYWIGPVRRISPEAPVPIVHVQETQDRPGGAGNVALNVSALGAQATLLALVGCDPPAAILRTALENAGICAELETVATASTVTKLRILSHHQQLIRLDFEDGFADFDGLRLQNRFAALLERADVIVFSDYAKGCLRAIEPMIATARARGKPVLVDPKGSDFARYRGATVITPNEPEFKAVVGDWKSDDEMISKGQALGRELQLQGVLVTRGERGMTLIMSEGESQHIPSKAREVYDVTGAGDTVMATLAAAWAAGAPLPEATMLANLAAGIVVGKLGAATVSTDELRQAVWPSRPAARGILAREELVRQVAEARRRGERIVMTNGCFDLLHAGHVQYLEQASRLGDRLIVAVNSDDSVRRLKGPGRPVNPLSQRMMILAALAVVDWVVPFGEDTPHELIVRVQPDVLVKGSDYRLEEIVGGSEVKAAGGEVVVLDCLQGCSTTAMMERIRSSADGPAST